MADAELPLDRQELLRTTRLLPFFVGLRLLPMGVWFLLVALACWDWIPFVVLLPLLAVALLAVWRIHSYYRTYWGQVERGRSRLGRNWVLLACVVLAYAALEIEDLRGDWRELLALFVGLLVATMVLLALPTPFGRRYGASLSVALVALALGAVFLVLIGRGVLVGSTGALFALVAGCALLAGGVLDHRALVTTLGPAREGRSDG